MKGATLDPRSSETRRAKRYRNSELAFMLGYPPCENEQEARGEIELFVALFSGCARPTLGVLKAAKRTLRNLGSSPLDGIGA